MAFVHLRSHTEFSVVDGTLRIDELVDAAAGDGQAALAITDLSNLFGGVKFYKEARKAGVKPVLGADVWLEPDTAAGEKLPSRLLLLAQNRNGYLNLCEILSRAWIQDVQQGRAWVRWESLAALGSDLIVLSGADLGAVGQALLANDTERAKAIATRLSDLFPQRFYIELQRAGLPGHEPHVRAAVPLAAELGLPVVATHPLQFQTPEDFEAHEARTCIAEGETLTNPRRVKKFTRDQHFKTQAEMEALFADVPTAIRNTVEIAKRCSLTLVLGKPRLPDFPVPEVEGRLMEPEEYFRYVSHEGLKERMIHLFPDPAKREAENPRYVERLDFEINTILKMGFPGYFLIVADFIIWAKGHGCPVGPGRGSGAGSLVAYALKITDLDPLRYNLLFERFLNPERVSMPDFDIDFCQGNRDRVIDYVKDKYGREAVSQIATFGTMAAKAALRDVGRVLGMGYGHVDGVAKLVPAPPGKTVTLKRPGDKPDPGIIYARTEAPEIEQREKNEEEVAELLALAERVEGMVRNIGMHAGGVLIAPGKITDFCPLYMQPGSDSAVSQYDKDDVEAIGLVKFDFLGLATLTILELAKDYIRARRPKQENFAFENIPLNDRASYQLMSEGKTVAVFQLESSGMQRMLKDAKPSVFEDIIALVALYRPGPMDLIPSFCARKHGREEVEYPHPLMKSVLEETYGIMVYQEQVMQVAQIVGGYSLGGADLLRRAMGKKKLEEMVAHRATFAEGAGKQGIEEPKANEIFDLMEKFAGYGFNKSHAAAYALLAYHTAYLKAHYLAEFTAANMSVALDDTDKLKIFHDDAVKLGLTFEPPNINTCNYRFEPVADKVVRYGLGAVKGTGQSAVEAIIEARAEGGPFKSIFDFAARVDRSRINKRTVEALIKAGAFDLLHPERSQVVASIGLAFEYADTQAAHADQGGLFDFDDSHGASTTEPDLVEAKPWSIKERLSLEKIALGFYLSGHLFDQSGSEVRKFARREIADLIDTREPQVLAGIVGDLRVINGQRGRVAIFKLDDKSEMIEAVANEELLNANKDLLKDDELIIVLGKAQPDRFSGGMRLNVQQVWDLPTARCRFGKYLRVEVNGSVPPVTEVLRDHPSRRVETEEGTVTQGLPVRLVLHREGASGELDLGDEGRFYPSDAALERWLEGSHGKSTVVYD
ncbi:DNA polymerase III subunit alpha [Piscinibacter gummiphilus]|uniref:DNA polymerase III subunit alpha n=1 Tax=Piscinibacter gummiphilus TaxID=946333 RepID=A0A1W6L6B6_9BURK|nr:DNA polymerase III subunit alpha [Piscinibacter gummiphilus]ARN19871.1 DNA polymerase III subunit alpha [Piscinibacter gummiphilus]ATU64544.1 DNA polymerase III subunit alpha [Piscinibacter gummiphilus]GLS95045.1 DNA-directed DNA polymerase [Piscinibacter gummiphilus]